MSRQGINEIIPGRLFQRGHFLTWPSGQKQAMLLENRITCVVNLWHKVDPDLSATRHNVMYINWHISPSHMPADVEPMVTLLTSLIEGGGHRMLVHCEAGRGRSVWLVTRLLANLSGLSRPEAFSRVKEAVGSVSVHGPLEEDLR